MYAGPFCQPGPSVYCCGDNVCLEDLNNNGGHACCAQLTLTPDCQVTRHCCETCTRTVGNVFTC